MPSPRAPDLLRSLLVDDDRRRDVPRVFTRAEAAAILRVSLSTIDRQRASGKLPSFKIGRAVRIDLAELRALVE